MNLGRIHICAHTHAHNMRAHTHMRTHTHTHMHMHTQNTDTHTYTCTHTHGSHSCNWWRGAGSCGSRWVKMYEVMGAECVGLGRTGVGVGL